MWVVLLYFEIILSALMMATSLDVSHAIKVKAMLQGAADAASLAGAWQNHKVIDEVDEYGAIIRYHYELNDDLSPEQAAWETWNKNVSNFTEGAGFNTVPTFQRTWDNKGIQCNVTQTVRMQISQTVANRLLGEVPDVKVQVPVRSIAKALPYVEEN